MKIIDHRNLPEERLATNDADGRRVYVFPAAVRGYFRSARNLTQAVLVLFFLVLPWIQINGHQALLLDITRRKFAVFGWVFWAHDTPMLFFVLLFLVISLAFVTAIWGRVWCGWACPQTVFIDGLFRRIDQWVVGNHLEQMRLARSPWNIEKIRKWMAKWGLYAIAGLVISHSFIAYFVGVEELRKIILRPPSENFTAFSVMLFITALVVFDFGWFREQFCIIMCPYGRIQSVLMGKNSLAILYDEKRGEPRGKLVANKNGASEKNVLTEKTEATPTPRGDCIDCYKCVSVCPTGIDIRRGVQMECIACTACIDACNEVMEKIQKPKNLIRYDSVANVQGQKRHRFTPRVWVYLGIMAICCIGLAWNLSNRKSIDVSILRGHDLPFTYENETDHTGKILNHFKINIKNQAFEDLKVSYTTSNNVEMVSPMNPVIVKPGELIRLPVFFKFPKEASQMGQLKIPLTIKAESSTINETIVTDINLAAPL